MSSSYLIQTKCSFITHPHNPIRYECLQKPRQSLVHSCTLSVSRTDLSNCKVNLTKGKGSWVLTCINSYYKIYTYTCHIFLLYLYIYIHIYAATYHIYYIQNYMDFGPHLLPTGGPEWWKVSLGTDGPLVLQKSIGFSDRKSVV